jgi:hypothetical protein
VIRAVGMLIPWTGFRKSALIDRHRRREYQSPMVEYALILAHNAAGFLPQNLASFVSQVHWQSLGYAALALLGLRLAVWAFRPSH